MSRLLSIAAATVASLVLFASAAFSYGDLLSSATCTDGSTIHVQWSFYEYSPTACPEWVGYDVYRRSLTDCEAWTRINAEPFARVAGTHDHQLDDVPPLPSVTYEYRIDFVDAARNVVSCAGICGQCSPLARASAPAISAPITHGRLTDWGWALYITPCATGCYPSYYIEGPIVDELRPYAVSGEALRFWGTEACGTVEGCALEVDHYQVAGCDATPVRRSTWGQLKTIFR